MDRMTDKELQLIKGRVNAIASLDVQVIYDKESSYRGSWRRRGGVGAFFNLERKWDRLVVAAENCELDLFEAHKRDARREGMIDDVRDLRRYLFLLEEYITRDVNKSKGLSAQQKRPDAPKPIDTPDGMQRS